MPRPIITLTTDFGQTDGYVGTMKGAMLGICPQATLVDISHEIRPQAVHQAAYILGKATPYFPPETVHLVVVDPGVGSARRPIVVQTSRAMYVAPDNGVLSWVLGQETALLAVHLTEASYRLPRESATFHGRDVFAPAAAHLACGTEPCEMGKTIPLSGLVALPALRREPQGDGSWRGEILHVDHFGNLVSSLQFPTADAQYFAVDSQFCVTVGDEQVRGLRRAFADVEVGELVVYIGSDGYLEVAVRNGNAATRLNVDIGDPIWVKGLVDDALFRPVSSHGGTVVPHQHDQEPAGDQEYSNRT
jgi:S-adenosylmethionine hydrolase